MAVTQGKEAGGAPPGGRGECSGASSPGGTRRSGLWSTATAGTAPQTPRAPLRGSAHPLPAVIQASGAQPRDDARSPGGAPHQTICMSTQYERSPIIRGLEGCWQSPSPCRNTGPISRIQHTSSEARLRQRPQAQTGPYRQMAPVGMVAARRTTRSRCCFRPMTIAETQTQSPPRTSSACQESCYRFPLGGAVCFP